MTQAIVDLETDQTAFGTNDSVVETLKSEGKEVEHNDEAVTHLEEVLPEKFKGKDLLTIVKSYEELEKQYGKQGSELGELRKLTDEFLRRQLSGDPDKDNLHTRYTNDNTELDILNGDPAVDKILQQKLAPVLAEVQEIKREKMSLKLNKDHPDYVDIIKDPEFAEWVKKSKVRSELYIQADQGFDFEAADELFTVWKERKGIKNKPAEKPAKKVDEEALKKASLETGVASDNSSKPVYRRADMVRLRLDDPARYAAMEPEIMQAYREGRVK